MLPLFQKNSHSFGKQQIIRQIRTLSRITKNKKQKNVRLARHGRQWRQRYMESQRRMIDYEMAEM